MVRGKLGPEAPTPVVSGTTGPTAGDRLLIAGGGRFWAHPLDGRELVIGRGEDCDLVIDHRALSRRHARLRLGPPPTVEDLGSTNGTRVGDEVRRGGAPVPVPAGDGFHIGPFSFVVMTAGGNPSLSLRDAVRVLDPDPTGVPALVRDVATTTTSVLILGETGVGKEVLAETLHALSGRTGPLTSINCAALAETLLESELFGHEKGAFTGATSRKPGLLEASAGGTVFLDELGEMPLAIQAKLLRVVERREVVPLGSTRATAIDVRFIAATNRDLPAEVAAGRFRRDLFYRLDGLSLVIPPLRERRALIAPLARRFARERAPGVTLAPDVIGALESHDWPGNVRELRAVIERALLHARGEPLALRHLRFARRDDSPPPPPRASAPIAGEPTPPARPGDDDLGFLTAEQRDDRARVLAALADCVGNQTRAARQLGISRSTLVTKLRLYRVPRPRT